jgi:hypothetical protein
MKITQRDLLDKLEQLDERLVNIWLADENSLEDDDIWDIFALLLETRVELLKSCKDAGIKLSVETCLPEWLDRLVNRQKEVRLRDLRGVARELEQRRKLRSYDKQLGAFSKTDSMKDVDETP